MRVSGGHKKEETINSRAPILQLTERAARRFLKPDVTSIFGGSSGHENWRSLLPPPVRNILGKFYFEMTGKRKRSCYRKTRERKGFGGALKSPQSSKETPSKETEIESRPGTSHDLSDQSDSGEESDQPLSSSRKKMKLQSSEDESSDFA